MSELVDDTPEKESTSDKIAREIIDEFGYKEGLEQIARPAGFTGVPPTIDEFIDEDEFMGKILGGTVYPGWRPELKRIFPNPFYSPYNEILAGGAIGIGKTTLSLVVQAMDMCKLTYMSDPHRTFQFIQAQPIVIAFFNAPQPLSALVSTPAGFKKMGDIRVGDEISSSAGDTTKVLGVYPQGIKKIYKIKFHDGREVRCDENHLWLVKCPRVNKWDKNLGKLMKQQMQEHSFPEDFLLLPTKQMQEELAKPRHKPIYMSVPVAAPVIFTEHGSIAPVDPYLLGLLLGDGCITTVAPYLATKDQEIAEYAQSMGFFTHNSVDKSAIKLYAKGEIREDVVSGLRKLELLGCKSGTKFIPERYMSGSIDERFAILQGLFDTDGCCSTRGTISYTTISERLAENIRSLVESLGGVALIHKLPSRESPHPRDKTVMLRNNKPQFILHCRLPDNTQFFRLTRKKIKVAPAMKFLGRRIVSIEETDQFEECACIKVDHPNHLYLTDNYVVTHNTMSLSQKVLMSQFTDWINSSPYFLEQRAKCIDKKAFLPNKLGIISASRASHVLGMAIVGGVLSEIEFMDKVKNQPVENYRQVQRRMQSRFGRGDNLLEPGHLIIDSSARFAESFLSQHMLVSYNDPRTLTLSKSFWEIQDKLDKMPFSGKTFKLFIGDAHRDPMILDGIGAAFNIPVSLVIDVPVEFLKYFEQDIFGAVRDIAGKSTMNVHKFFSQVKMLEDAMCLPNPCDTTIVELDFADSDDRLITHVDLSKLSKDSTYYIHFDIGIKHDKTGIALTRKSGDVIVNRVGRMLDSSVVQDAIYHTDLVLAVAPRPGKEVPIAKLRNFIIDLTHAHIKVGCVSADGFQSAQLLQEMKNYGLNSELVSVDRSRDPYDQFKNVILEGRWAGPIHPILRKEFLDLIDVGKKIDHPNPNDVLDKKNRPSKDLADAVVGSVYLCKEKGSSDAGMQALNEYIKAMHAAEKEATVKDHIFELGRKNKHKNRFGL